MAIFHEFRGPGRPQRKLFRCAGPNMDYFVVILKKCRKNCLCLFLCKILAAAIMANQAGVHRKRFRSRGVVLSF